MAIFCSLKIYLKTDSNKVTKVKEAHVTFPAAKFKRTMKKKVPLHQQVA